MNIDFTYFNLRMVNIDVVITKKEVAEYLTATSSTIFSMSHYSD